MLNDNYQIEIVKRSERKSHASLMNLLRSEKLRSFKAMGPGKCFEGLTNAAYLQHFPPTGSNVIQ